jgi:ABC-2 type transport system ATP-binding protein
MSIKVNNITKQYGEQKALHNVSFEVNNGEIVGFLGPNGAGKSTMMKIITGFISQTEGTASVCGFDVTENSMDVRRNVGYLPENNPLYLDMYVKEYLAFIAGLQGMKQGVENRVKEMIEMTGLQVEHKKKIGALSKGYRQRVGLAQALIHDPKVLILDEPTTGLDPNQLTEIRSLIKNIGKEKTVILSTHIMQEVKAICSRVIIINKGEIVANDSTEQLQKKIGGFIVLSVEFDKEAIASTLKAIKGVQKIKNTDGNRWLIDADESSDIRSEVFNFAVSNNMKVLAMQILESSLEDVFHQLTK